MPLRQSFVARARTTGALLLTLSLVASPAHGVQPLAVFLQGGRSYSTDNRERSAENRRATAGADAAFGEILPGFRVGGLYTHNQREIALALPGGTDLTLQPRNELQAALSLHVPLVDLPGYYGARAAAHLAKAASAEVRATSLDVDREVAAAYFEYTAAGALTSSAKKTVESAAENLRFVEDLFSAGRTTDLEYERAVANLERARQNEADAVLAIALTARRLHTLTGITPTASTPPADDELGPEAPIGYFLSRAGSTPAEVAARAATAAATSEHAAARAQMLPTLSGIAQERLTSPAAGGHHASYALMLVLDFRMDYALPAEARVRAAEVEIATARAEAARRSAADAIYDAYQRVDSLIVKCRAARAQSRAANRAAELAADRFEAGKATQLDVTQAQRDAFLADASQIQADASLAFGRVALRLAADLPLPTSTSKP